MTYIVKRIDPAKVAQLGEREYETLFRIADSLNNGVKERDLSADLYASTFHLMRNCGVTNLRCHDGMRVVALQLKQSRLLIERLRTYSFS